MIKEFCDSCGIERPSPSHEVFLGRYLDWSKLQLGYVFPQHSPGGVGVSTYLPHYEEKLLCIKCTGEILQQIHNKKSIRTDEDALDGDRCEEAHEEG
jgi:hypothetical protein